MSTKVVKYLVGILFILTEKQVSTLPGIIEYIRYVEKMPSLGDLANS